MRPSSLCWWSPKKTSVLLRDFEELTIAEIAERLDEQPGAIKSRLHRARELVREYMIGPQAVAKNPKEIQ